MHFPQDGSSIPRELWLQPWPRSKKGNQWVRAFGLTYTIAFNDHVSDAYKLTVVGPGGERYDHTFNEKDEPRDIKEWLWPDPNRELPWTLADLKDGELP